MSLEGGREGRGRGGEGRGRGGGGRGGEGSPLVILAISYYKLEGHFFRTGRLIAPTF